VKEHPAQQIELRQETELTYLIIKNELSQLMSLKVGIVRNRNEMAEALKRINEIILHYPDNQTDYNWKKIYELATVCKLICISALEREESRGGHVRSDFPDESNLLVHHIIQEKGRKISTEKVRNNI